MSIGTINAGELQIGNGFTLQELPKELNLEVKLTRQPEGETQGQLVFSLSGERFVKAAITTQGGLMPVTKLEGKTVAYPVVGENGKRREPYVLTGVRGDVQQGVTKGALQFDIQKVAFNQ
jgi:hypothetical protein